MIKRIFLATLILVLLGSSAGAVKFDEAMQKEAGLDGLFPSWASEASDTAAFRKCQQEIPGAEAINCQQLLPQVDGVIGTNRDDKENSGGEKLLMFYIPHLINILLKFVAPLIMATMVYAGIRFVYAGSNEEELNQAKEFFTYTLMGALFVVLSYSIMKALYYILASS